MPHLRAIWSPTGMRRCGDMQALAELAVVETNRGYVNSGIGITMELSGYETLDYKEEGMTSDLARFRETADVFSTASTPLATSSRLT